MLHVLLPGAPNPILSAAVAKELSQLTQHHLHKDPAATAVAIGYIAPEHWFVGGTSLGAHNTKSFSLEIKITAATNTKAEMADYQQAVFAAMTRLLGPLHEESYIVVHEVPAASYGHGGLTQEFRFISGQLKKAA
jgi:4-oxalocrotonate tautomerase